MIISYTFKNKITSIKGQKAKQSKPKQVNLTTSCEYHSHTEEKRREEGREEQGWQTLQEFFFKKTKNKTLSYILILNK